MLRTVIAKKRLEDAADLAGGAPPVPLHLELRPPCRR